MPSHQSYQSPLLIHQSTRAENDLLLTKPQVGDFDASRRAIVLLFPTLALAAPTMATAAQSTSSTSSKSLSEDYRQGTAALADMDDQAPVPNEAYKKLPSGVIYADLRPGSPNANEAKPGSRCNMQWVLRKSNGYFVDSSQVQGDVPFIFVVGDGSAIAGVDEGVQGMKEGGVRRLLIPPSLAYVQGLEDGLPGPLPQGFGPRQQMRRVQNLRKDVPGEYVYLEVQLTRVR
jgi:FKBP-type peptidyl-prolyl cis-trans isomerase